MREVQRPSGQYDTEIGFDEKDVWTKQDLADAIGVSNQRINYLIHGGDPLRGESEAGGRVEGVRWVKSHRGPWRYEMPAWPRIKRGEYERPGPLLDYIEAWEARHGIRDVEEV